MRSLERWLHQHIFKVGWLLTKNLQTTTILYYTFFLPGVSLHEVIVWLMAGILNVRATGEFKFPDKQEIAELKLTFVKYDTKKIGTFRLFVINLMPLVGGVVFVWFVVTQVMQTDLLIRVLGGDATIQLGDAITQLIRTPDFLLWTYLLFTVSATMTPDPSYLRGWRLLLPPLALILLVLIALGIVGRVLTNVLVPLVSWANLISGVFIAVIAVNLFMTAVLGGIESLIERITGDSATFEKGKLVAMRREEILKARAEQAEKARKAAQRQQRQQAATPAGPPSIYKLQFPIPGGPDKEGTLIGEQLGQTALPGLDGEPLLSPPPPAIPATVTPAAAAATPAVTAGSSVPPTTRPVSSPATPPAPAVSKPTEPTVTSADAPAARPIASPAAGSPAVSSVRPPIAPERPANTPPSGEKPAESPKPEPTKTDATTEVPKTEAPKAEPVKTDGAPAQPPRSPFGPSTPARPAFSPAPKPTSTSPAAKPPVQRSILDDLRDELAADEDEQDLEDEIPEEFADDESDDEN